MTEREKSIVTEYRRLHNGSVVNLKDEIVLRMALSMKSKKVRL